eukprot:365355-Chlamydomonas_euryale.AAC.13
MPCHAMPCRDVLYMHACMHASLCASPHAYVSCISMHVLSSFTRMAGRGSCLSGMPCMAAAGAPHHSATMNSVEQAWQLQGLRNTVQQKIL